MSYSVKNALTRRNKEAIDEDKRSQYPYRVANKRVFDLERKSVLEETPRTQVSAETFQESSLLANKVLVALSDVESNLRNSYIYGVDLYNDRINTSTYARAKEYIVEYINDLKFKVIPSVNSSRNPSLISQTSINLERIIRKLTELTSRMDTAIEEAGAHAEGLDDNMEMSKTIALEEILINELDEFEKLLEQLKVISSTIKSYASTSSRAPEKGEDPTLFKNNPELYALQDVNEAFAEDEELNELDYDPIGQQQNQFEEGERVYRDEQKQDEDDLEGMGLRFRLAKTKRKNK